MEACCTHLCEGDFEGEEKTYHCLKPEGHSGYHLVDGNFGFPQTDVSLQDILGVI